MELLLLQPFLSRIEALVTDLERRVLRQLETSEPDSVLEVGTCTHAHSQLLLFFFSKKDVSLYPEFWGWGQETCLHT